MRLSLELGVQIEQRVDGNLSMSKHEQAGQTSLAASVGCFHVRKQMVLVERPMQGVFSHGINAFCTVPAALPSSHE